MTESRSAGFWGLGRTIRNKWTWHRHGYITSEFKGFEIRIGVVPEPEGAYEPDSFHATTAHLDEDGDWDWELIEDPYLPEDWKEYEDHIPGDIWLN